MLLSLGGRANVLDVFVEIARKATLYSLSLLPTILVPSLICAGDGSYPSTGRRGPGRRRRHAFRMAGEPIVSWADQRRGTHRHTVVETSQETSQAEGVLCFVRQIDKTALVHRDVISGISAVTDGEIISGNDARGY